MKRKKRCWKGYKPVKGKRPYSKGSCRRVLVRNAYRAIATPKSLAKFFAFQKDGTTENYTAFLPKAEEYFARGEGQEAQRLMLRRMRMERGNDVDLRRLQGNRRKKMKFSDQRIRKLVNDYPDNTTRAMSSIALDYGIPYNRVYRAVHKKIPRSTARAMVRAGLPLSRSELRGNPLGVRVTTRDERKIPRKFPLYYTGPAPRMPLVYLYDDLTRLMKNRDELLMDFDIRERPGHPYDFIIIAKFRSYVSGARLYSAGLKTKSRIENTLAGFGKLIGYRSKRIGNSDYSYEIFAIRLDKELHKPQSGKLFGNPKSFPNIDKSGFHKGQYVGYSPKAVNVFSITRDYRGWKAIGQIYKTTPKESLEVLRQQGYPGVTTKIIYGKDLAEISNALENL